MPKKADPLRHIPLFSVFSEPDRRRIADEMVEDRYAKGQCIFREGDPADSFHILKEGSVKCVKTSADGKEIALKVLMPGDLFCCEAAVFDGSLHPGCAIPLEDVTVLRLSKKSYLEILRQNPDAALEVVKYLGKRLNEAQENAKVLARDRAEQRMAALLINLADRAGARERNGLRLTVRLTRQDLADMTGITVETAIRVMSRFKEARLVSGTAKRLVIWDLPKLRQLTSASCQNLLMPARRNGKSET